MITNKTKIEKEFDSVQMMRQIRNEISLETQNMNYEDFKLYIDKQLKLNRINKLDNKSLNSN